MRSSAILGGLFGLALGLGPPQPGARAEPAPRLPVSAFFSNPRITEVRISPDGTHVASVVTQRGREYLSVFDVEAGEPTPVLAFPDPNYRLRTLLWANDRRLVFGMEYPFRAVGVRARGTRLWAINRDGSERRWLGDEWQGGERIQFQDGIVHRLPGSPDHILLSLDTESDGFPGVYRVEVGRGRRSSVQRRTHPIRYWIADHEGRVRAGVGGEGTDRIVIARADGDSDFETLVEGDPYSTPDFHPLGFDFDDPSTLYVASSHEGDRRAVYEYDIPSKAFKRRVFGHPEFDVDGPLVVSRARRKVVAVGYWAEQPELHWLDEEAAQDHASLDAALGGIPHAAVSSSLDGSRRIVRTSDDTHPAVYYLYLRDRRELIALTATHPDLDPRLLAEMKPISYPSRDGMTIPGYLTLPVGVEPKNLPVVVYPHGGPSARDVRAFDPTVQLLANRGYAVLQMNFRGSTGYGAAHQSAGYQRWGLEMQDDITDGVRWLIGQGIADPDRVAIFGASYGGYAALMGLVKTPELFRCAASYAGVTDLLTMLNDDRWYLFDDHNVPMVGDSGDDRERLEATSPLRNVEGIRAPVLLGHGENDSRVHVKHAHQLADALREAGKPVELLVFEDEVHGFYSEANRLRFYEALDKFLARHLAPRPKSDAVAQRGE